MPKNVLSIQPLAAMFTVLAAEYERVVGKSVTLGFGINSVSIGDEDDPDGEASWSSADIKLRYYPQGNAPQGFSLGGSVGGTQVKGTNNTTTPPTDEEASGGSVGVLLEYQWLLGAKKKFAIALGVGAKALMIDDSDVTVGSFTARYPTARVSIGYAF